MTRPFASTARRWVCLGAAAAAWLGAGGPAARAQCLPLRVLTAAGANAGFAHDSLDAYLPAGEWARHQSLPGASEELSWSHAGAATQPGTGALLLDDAVVSLRRSNQQRAYDVVLKTVHKSCFNQVRAELRRRGLKPEPVNCVGCLGERFVGPLCTVTLYDHKPGFDKGSSPYPYVVVVRSTAAPAGPGNTSGPHAAD